MDNDEGCKDVDECLEENKCPKSNERCINLVGSYRCECSEGYKRNKDQECEINIEGLFDLILLGVLLVFIVRPQCENYFALQRF